jgi:protein-tyrosine-phosphatase
MKILFVCSGNICRSAMADAYARKRVAESGPPVAMIDSAGTLGIAGATASPEAIGAMVEIGVDLSSHRSRGLDRSLLEHADVIVGMTRAHLDEIENWSDNAGRHYLLRAFEEGPDPAPDATDLPDPIGRDASFYRETRDVITRCVDHLLEWIARGAPAAG